MSCIYFYYEDNSSLPVILEQDDKFSMITISNLINYVPNGKRIFVQINKEVFATEVYGKSA